MQIWLRTVAKRKVTLTMCMFVSAASNAHNQGEKCFPEEKTVSSTSGVVLYLLYNIHNDQVYILLYCLSTYIFHVLGKRNRAELFICGPEQSAVQYYSAKYGSSLVSADIVNGKDLYSSRCHRPFCVKVQ